MMAKQPATKGKSIGLSPSSPVGTQSIQRAAFLLRLIAANNKAGLRLVDLVRHSGLEQPTVHRMLKAMIAENMVIQRVENRRYFLGPILFELGLAAEQHYGLREICQSSLVRIAEKTGDTVFLTVRRGREAVCIDRKDGAFPVKVFTLNVGDRRALGVGAGGLAILAELPEVDAEQVIEGNSKILGLVGGLNAKEMKQRVAQARRQGYGIHDVLNVSGVKAVGVAIKNAEGDPFAALSISAVATRIANQRIEELVVLLRKEASVIQKMMNRQGGDFR
jgi:DNA-binding IclR family transcriptional regulator